MELKSLRIATDSPYLPVSPDNPYRAKIAVGYNDNRFEVELSDEVIQHILSLCEVELVEATKAEFQSFRTMVNQSSKTVIEHEKGTEQ